MRTWWALATFVVALGLPPAYATPAGPTKQDATSAGLDAQVRTRALHIMLKGSLNVSRTKAVARRFYAPKSASAKEIATRAEDNFTTAASYVLANASELVLSLATATKLNKMLTLGLVPEALRGKATFRRNPTAFFRWLASPEATKLVKSDPVALAERVHRELSLLDSFPDGNGRTARLMADLVLLKSGHAPAYYTGIEDYFARGSVRAPTSLATKLGYFREIVGRGDAALRAKGAIKSAPLSREFRTRLHGQFGQDGAQPN